LPAPYIKLKKRRSSAGKLILSKSIFKDRLQLALSAYRTTFFIAPVKSAWVNSFSLLLFLSSINSKFLGDNHNINLF